MTPSKLHSPEECYLSYHLSKEVLSNPENPMDSPTLKDALNGWSDMMEILRKNADRLRAALPFRPGGDIGRLPTAGTADRL